MLVCSQCQFENPDNHKFCQKCGAPLDALALELETSKADVALSDVSPALEQWLAVLCLTAPPKPPVMTSSSVTQAMPAAVGREVGEYLDPGDRYQLLEPLPDVSATVAATLEINVRVIDRRAHQPSYLEQLDQAIAGLPVGSSEAISGTAELDDPLSLAAGCVPLEINQVPKTAKTYLDLQDELYPAMPQLHDAWVQDYAERSMNVVVLEDRSTFPTLLHCMKNEDVVPFQVLTWLYDMTKLWEVLEACGYSASVLEPNNLHIDEGQVLCLQRLHADYPGHAPSLKDLGSLWQNLFQQSQRTQLGALSKLCADLELGAIETLVELQERLEAIAQELQEPLFGVDVPLMANVPTQATSAAQPSSESPMTDFTPAPETDDDNLTLDPPTLPPPELSEAIALGAGSADEDSELDEDDDTSTPTLMPPMDDASDESDDLPTIVLPMKLISLEDAGRTDIGQQRKHNEDYFSIHTQIQKADSPLARHLTAKGLYILCDGMGGHSGGEVASSLAVETLEQYFEEHWHDQLPTEQVIREAVLMANKAIYDLNQQNFRSGSGRMGTTLVLVLIQGTEAAIAHVGDSRLYRFTRRMGLEQLTVDHEVGQREIQRGVEPSIAYARPDAYQLTQALGPRDQNFVDPDIAFLELTEDALFLLCSDGLTDDNLLEKHWRTHVEPLLSSQTNLEQGVVQLIDLANHYNGHDNITSVAVRAKVRPDVTPPRRV
ncbi:MAG: serine/threonine phosphatase [Elainellaceae cyanobacterium]